MHSFGLLQKEINCISWLTFSEAMDLSLWDPPIFEDESSDFGGNFVENWESDFYFGYGRDVMEEDALNQQACTQVLNILISKADTEIEELEQEIVMIQSQLGWADQVWSKIYSTTLREKINSLDMLIQILENEKQQTEQAPDFHLQTQREPAEKLSEILKTLLENYSPNIDEQNLSSNSEKLATSQSKDETNLSNFKATCGEKLLEETIGPLYMADPTKDVKEKDQNGDTTSSDLITNFYGHATDGPTHKVNPSVHVGQETGFQDSPTRAEKRMRTTQFDKHANAMMINTNTDTLRWEADSNCIKGACNHSEEKSGGVVVKSFEIDCINLKPSQKPKETIIAEADMLADMASGCTADADAAKLVVKGSVLKQKLKMLEDANRTNLIDTTKQLVRTERMRTKDPPKMKPKESWLSDSDCTIGESLIELLNNRREARKPLIKAREEPLIVEEMQNTEVIGTGSTKSNLLLKPGRPRLTEKDFPIESLVAPEPSLAMEMEHKFSSKKNFKRNMMSRTLEGHADKNCINKKTSKGTHLNLNRDKTFIVAEDVSMDSVCWSTGKRKKCVASPLIKKNEELRNLQVNPKLDDGVTSSLMEEVEHITKDSHLKPLKSMPCTTSLVANDLCSLPLAQLRAVAKERKLTKYSKLKKSDLIKLLG